MKKQDFILWLLFFNTIGSVVWILGLHNIRLVLLSASGIILLYLFIIQKYTPAILFAKIWIMILFVIGLINWHPEYYPTIIIDLGSFGIIFSSFCIRNISIKQFKVIGLLLVAIPAIFYLFSIPLMDLSLFQNGSYDRKDAYNSIEDSELSGGASRAYVIYMTQQMMIIYTNMFLLFLPLYVKCYSKTLIRVVIAGIIFTTIIIAAYYQKRQPITELFLIFILVSLFYRKLLKGLFPKNIVFMFMFLLIVILFILNTGILDNTLGRVKETSENIVKFDRFEETKFVLSKFSIPDWIFGKGLGSVAKETAGYSMLHIGYANLVFKGGVVLLLIYLFNSIVNLIYCIKNSRTNPLFNIGIVISIYSMIQLTYTGGYHFYAPVIVTGLAMSSRYLLNSLKENN